MTLKLQGSTSGHTAIEAPASAGSNTLVLPPNNGTAGQVLSTDGNGNLTWVTPSKILQVKNAVETTVNQRLGADDTWVDMGPTCSITTTGTNDVLFKLSVGILNFQNSHWAIRAMRGSTVIREWWWYDNNSQYWLAQPVHYETLDTTVSAGTHTYKIMARADSNHAQFEFNYKASSQSSNMSAPPVSEIILMEVSA